MARVKLLGMFIGVAIENHKASKSAGQATPSSGHTFPFVRMISIAILT
jgi:hypothetical protein